jgi:hypothetical protein
MKCLAGHLRLICVRVGEVVEEGYLIFNTIFGLLQSRE